MFSTFVASVALTSWLGFANVIGEDPISESGTFAALYRRSRILVNATALLVPSALALVGWLLVNQTHRANELRSAVQQSFERRLELEHILSLHQDIETASRGYVLTGAQAFLQPYRMAEPQIDLEFAAMDRFNRGPSAASPLANLRKLSEEKRAFARETIQLSEAGKQNAAIARVRSGNGLALMDGIRAEIAALEQSEARKLQALSARSTAAQQRVELTALVVLFSLMALLATAGLLIARSIRARAGALEAVADLARRRRAILDAAMDGIFILNPSGTIESVNLTGARMFGYDVEELIRRDVGMLFASEPPIGQIAAFLRQMNLREGEPGDLQEIPGRCKDGHPMAADVAISAVDLSDGMHYVAVVRDMSERKKVDRMKAEFVASVSHELRTPLTSISGSLGLLMGGAAGELAPRAEQLISIAHSNADRLVRLVNDILDIEKIDAGRMAFDNRILRLADICAQAIEANRPYSNRLGVRLELEAPSINECEPFGEAVVWADPDRLMQVLTNLISNAAKFSPRGEAVQVGIRPGEREHRISICDRGPGIPPEFASRIFSRFAQADSSDARQKDGTGLGLAIVRELTARLGGKVSYESVPGQGTQFFVDLPAARPDQIDDGLERLLLCEHDPSIAGAIATALAATGMRCDIVASAIAAKDAAAQSSYRVILVDSNLPSEGGIALVRDLRANADLVGTPILMISAESERGVIGVDALHIAEWLRKPVALDAVVAAVTRAVEHLSNGRMPRILHIEDDPDIVRLVQAAFEGKALLTSVSGLGDARTMISQGGQDLAILDLGLSDGSGLELLPDLAAAQGGPIPVIVFSAQDADPEVAERVQAYLTKSHTPIERLVRTVIRLARATEVETSA